MDYIYFAGAMGMWIALQESGEKFSWWWLVLIATWPTWLVLDHVSEKLKTDRLQEPSESKS